MTLDDKIIIYPAHGEGSSCGKNLSSETFGTLGDQKKTIATDADGNKYIQETGNYPNASRYVRVKAKTKRSAKKIVDNGDWADEDVEKEDVLEVGPGTGNLTREIINKKPNKIFLIEKDKLLYRNLKKEFKNKINIFNEDILKTNEKNLSNKKLTVFVKVKKIKKNFQ